MNLVVSALASILPSDSGIDAFNHKIYEGLPVLGCFSEDRCSLLSGLQKQLNCSSEDINILLGEEPVEAYELAKNITEALAMAEGFLEQGASSVNIFGLEINDADQCIVDTVPFAYADGFDFNDRGYGSNFALAFSLTNIPINNDGSSEKCEYSDILTKDPIEYFACLESKKNIEQVEVIESISHESLDILSDEFVSFKKKNEKESCYPELALSSIASILGYNNKRLDIAAFIKGVLQCYHRYIVGMPNWSRKNMSFSWKDSSCYVPPKSKFWFVNSLSSHRYVMLRSSSSLGISTLFLSDRGLGLDRNSQYFSYAAPHFFPLLDSNEEGFKRQLASLKVGLLACSDNMAIGYLAEKYYQKMLNDTVHLNAKHDEKLRAVLLGETAEVLLKECEAMVLGINKVLSQSENDLWEFKTPKGSYFTSKPLGLKGKVAFVFPGLGSSYIGLGQNIFHLFPSIYKESFHFTENVGEELQEKVLYPRTQDALSFKEKRQLDMEMFLNLKNLGKIDTTYSSICSHVMTDVFKVQPDMAFGYSMGEANMMTALGVWKNPTDLEQRFKQSDIFQNRLYGDLSTVKDYWNIAQENDCESLWLTCTIKASKKVVERCIEKEALDRVFLTLVNTEDNVVIAGEPKSCLALIEKLNVRAIPMGFVPAIHSKPAALEYEGIAELYSLSTNENCTTKLYSSSCYLQVPIREKTIAYSIAKCFSEQVDFPRLVNKVYDDGARIFLEAGAGRICSTWIDKILQNKKHVVVPLNAKGTDDSLTFARVIAKLFCHKVDVDLSPLYANVSDIEPTKSRLV